MSLSLSFYRYSETPIATKAPGIMRVFLLFVAFFTIGCFEIASPECESFYDSVCSPSSSSSPFSKGGKSYFETMGTENSAIMKDAIYNNVYYSTCVRASTFESSSFVRVLERVLREERESRESEKGHSTPFSDILNRRAKNMKKVYEEGEAALDGRDLPSYDFDAVSDAVLFLRMDGFGTLGVVSLTTEKKADTHEACAIFSPNELWIKRAAEAVKSEAFESVQTAGIGSYSWYLKAKIKSFVETIKRTFDVCSEEKRLFDEMEREDAAYDEIASYAGGYVNTFDEKFFFVEKRRHPPFSSSSSSSSSSKKFEDLWGSSFWRDVVHSFYGIGGGGGICVHGNGYEKLYDKYYSFVSDSSFGEDYREILRAFSDDLAYGRFSPANANAEESSAFGKEDAKLHKECNRMTEESVRSTLNDAFLKRRYSDEGLSNLEEISVLSGMSSRRMGRLVSSITGVMKKRAVRSAPFRWDGRLASAFSIEDDERFFYKKLDNVQTYVLNEIPRDTYETKIEPFDSHIFLDSHALRSAHSLLSGDVEFRLSSSMYERVCLDRYLLNDDPESAGEGARSFSAFVYMNDVNECLYEEKAIREARRMKKTGDVNFYFEGDSEDEKYDNVYSVTDVSTVNAWYDPTKNSITIPAGIMAPPIYSGTLFGSLFVSDYAEMGMILGHELGHALDPFGACWDETGNYDFSRKFCDRSTMKEKKRDALKCLVEEYGHPCGKDDKYGEHTLGEDVADQLGIISSWEVFSSANGSGGEGERKGRSSEETKEFFRKYASLWCDGRRFNYEDGGDDGETKKTRSFLSPLSKRFGKNSHAKLGEGGDGGAKKMTCERVRLDPHALPKHRVNKTLRQFSDFWRTFGCEEGSPMRNDRPCVVY